MSKRKEKSYIFFFSAVESDGTGVLHFTSSANVMNIIINTLVELLEAAAIVGTNSTALTANPINTNVETKFMMASAVCFSWMAKLTDHVQPNGQIPPLTLRYLGAVAKQEMLKTLENVGVSRWFSNEKDEAVRFFSSPNDVG